MNQKLMNLKWRNFEAWRRRQENLLIIFDLFDTFKTEPSLRKFLRLKSVFTHVLIWDVLFRIFDGGLRKVLFYVFPAVTLYFFLLFFFHSKTKLCFLCDFSVSVTLLVKTVLTRSQLSMKNEKKKSQQKSSVTRSWFCLFLINSHIDRFAKENQNKKFVCLKDRKVKRKCDNSFK